MKTLFIVAAVAGLLATAATAQDRDHEGDRDRGQHRDNFPGAIVGGTLRALVDRSEERDGRCRVVIERYRQPDGDVVVERHRECD